LGGKGRPSIPLELLLSALLLQVFYGMARPTTTPSTNEPQRHLGYGMSQTRRAIVECIFGWGKQHGTMRKTKHVALLASPPTSCSI
jgi:hypothetical protein